MSQSRVGSLSPRGGRKTRIHFTLIHILVVHPKRQTIAKSEVNNVISMRSINREILKAGAI